MNNCESVITKINLVYNPPPLPPNLSYFEEFSEDSIIYTVNNSTITIQSGTTNVILNPGKYLLTTRYICRSDINSINPLEGNVSVSVYNSNNVIVNSEGFNPINIIGRIGICYVVFVSFIVTIPQLYTFEVVVDTQNILNFLGIKSFIQLV